MELNTTIDSMPRAASSRARRARRRYAATRTTILGTTRLTVWIAMIERCCRSRGDSSEERITAHAIDVHITLRYLQRGILALTSGGARLSL
jgi:hypothetical protein